MTDDKTLKEICKGYDALVLEYRRLVFEYDQSLKVLEKLHRRSDWVIIATLSFQMFYLGMFMYLMGN